MDITEVRIKLMEDSSDRLRAFCSITFDDCFVVRDLKIIEGANGPFVAMPSRKLTSHCTQCGCKNHLRSVHCNQCGRRLNEEVYVVKDQEGRSKLYADIAHPINSTCREMIQACVLNAFTEELERASSPDYVSRYDDYFDAGEEGHSFEMEPAARGEQVTKVQHSEHGVRAPHKAPESKPNPSRNSDQGFGDGVF